MAINLTKGQSIVLSKSEFDLSRLTMALGWDVATAKTSLFGRSSGANFDLDSYALLLGENGKLKNYKEDVIYYSHLESKDKTVVHSGDNLTGAGDGDDEQIFVKLSSLSAEYHKIILGVNIYDAQNRKQHFGMVENAYVRAVDAAGKEIARYRLSNDPSYEGKLNMLMGQVYREGGEWKFKALGNPLAEDLKGVVGSFMR
ncbi:MAG: TerD family protein [Microcoleus sp. PH2017_10_PVI_O_A]|uniref:TerD family protein n=1 Tax=unclassified Microcoleus TaxID=2642155 RepID=UPI001E07C0AE|nr:MULTISPECIES: TerD family protein [unclassified Microcoleus]TAE86636.1 MAG: TerD family protein [Oscillatoriales cyanobacterium]MCC3409985.1 TerD family protein [Microcoleus sp. PH2017_10_PVI_O_A]MCC3464249.1 TerD family protein [Microcoleus sp. PH2017_11_PCY_U_A]MCC3482594.1 TerD family protein [Microcoleus sp. PH2017_12_PCY_D_A]MCC3532428.1 TerD family protein [Microcoleus sp. PH2017_21_RUC_O_A]